MNWVLALVAAIFIIGCAQGYRKGIIRIAVSLISMFVSIIACMFVTPALCTAIKNNTEIHSKMTASVYNIIIKSDMYNDAYDEAVDKSISYVSGNMGITDSEAKGVIESYAENNLSEYEAQVTEYVNAIAEAMKLPKSVMEGYKTSLLSDTVNELLTEKTVGVKSMLAAIFAARLADMAINSIVYIAVFAVVYIILKIVLMATGVVASLPFIRQANKMVGLGFGALEALVIVWLVFTVITAMGNFIWAQDALSLIGDNAFLRILYEKNVVTKTILGW